jgi:hypothetical protein
VSKEREEREWSRELWKEFQGRESKIDGEKEREEELMG